ncbi:MAG TPA: hypothetical protein VG167_04130 [Verrucomicrobiae bacterium]|nr:hypothetical protein [Verrucomicrobiae bacterium]
MKVFAPALLLGLGISVVQAQNYSIDWFKVAGGGGTSTGGPYSVSGTIGQADAGHLSGGNYTLDGGFWGIVAAVQTPGAPRLTIRLTGTNAVVVTWPSPSTGFSLQQNAIVGGGIWNPAGLTVNDNGTIKWVVVSAPAGNLFFRLKQ